MSLTRPLQLLILGALTAVLAGCAVSPETRARQEEYARTIPTCDSDSECEAMWQAARSWAVANSDFPIFSESETRIRATSTLTTNAGMGVVVHRTPTDNGYEFTVEMECFTAYGCGDVWEPMLDFNRVVAAAGN